MIFFPKKANPDKRYEEAQNQEAGKDKEFGHDSGYTDILPRDKR